ncbi:MAG: hypothetical protein A2315_15935 [Ignavibacteria bacterium RIFOXYB2_FULL_35_12]|nr:MAG: hypothetical protein A2058_01025 [Ignavibacteria bacterium GWA2_36_19]OGU49271.1 MAG: hypothetical protein A2006_08230 [Ignavibacteria bacterium GWC2_35_8]OGU60872.1 MAG: hypothetical protein A2X60_15465 [Ignavibacteria bacterium GWF2_35_20]OGU80694.1 MAG: hypothetical protein A2254_17105 [Ignavibacteria bacterium RIFOXYA2_FULL_35_9]OGU92080.1 MAG: hypothetical protein A3K31_12765 [Ignavibacteria bacterium RIFOXYA12_FULL_35_25]OGU95701.1 MAG: hypothetical protein A2347_01480 [Ignavibac
MIHQRTKDLILYFSYYLTKFLYPYYVMKYLDSANLYLHLGSGSNIISGFINIDVNPLRKGILYYDIRNKLPFKAGSVRFVFASNVFEHFYPDEIFEIFRNIYQNLESDGIIRIVVPDLEKAVDAYKEKKYSFFGAFPRSYKSIGGRFSNFIFCDAQHRITYDFSYLQELLMISGFNSENIMKMEFGISNLPQEIYNKIKPFEVNFANTDLFIEVRK